MLKSALTVAAIVLCCAANAQIANGGFESDDFTGWTQTLATGNNKMGAPYSALEVQFYGTSFFVAPTMSNKYFAFFNANSGKSDAISQTVKTTKGKNYTLSFYAGAGDNVGKNNITVSWDGTKEFNITLFETQSLLGDTLTKYSVTVTGTGSDALMISGGGGIAFDNVAFATPEPDPFAAFGVGVIGLAIRRRSRR